VEPGLLRDALTLLVGLFTGVLSALFGVGGAMVSNPGVRALGAPPLVAVGTTLPSLLPGAVSGTLRYQREGLVDWQVVAWASTAGLPVVVAGALLSRVVPGEGHLLLLTIAVLLAFTAWRTAFVIPDGDDRQEDNPARQEDNPARQEDNPARQEDNPARQEDNPARQEDNPARVAAPPITAGWRPALVGVVAGLSSGLLGIGGGVIMVPGFTKLRLSLKSAIATSLVCVGVFGVPATITHALLGHVDWRLAALLTIGVVPGARLGASLTVRADERHLRLVVGVFLGVIAVVYFVTEARALLTL
jgi:uncharacterized protein